MDSQYVTEAVAGEKRSKICIEFFNHPFPWLTFSYLTNNMPGVERFPLSFKSQFSGNHFHHIVLGVHSGGRFGALGMSRREDLMFKPLEFRTLMDLVQEFDGAYRGYWHTLHKVKIGQYVSHDPHSVEQIEWKHSILDVDKLTKEELRKELERHTRDMRLKVKHEADVIARLTFDSCFSLFSECDADLAGIIGNIICHQQVDNPSFLSGVFWHAVSPCTVTLSRAAIWRALSVKRCSHHLSC